MEVFISPDVVISSFRRLAYVPTNSGETKTSLERTSSLMYFFAFDIVAKCNNESIIDININSFDGKNTRSQFILEYAKLVQLKNSSSGMLQHVAALGTVQIGGKAPEVKMRSNFLSVQVVEATTARIDYVYPKRPAPLLLLGVNATGKKYGITYHPNCEQNISAFLTGLRGRIPYTDLAIFLCRSDRIIVDDATDGKRVLIKALKEKFTQRISDFLIDKIESEKLFSDKYISWNNFTSDKYVDGISENTSHSRRDELQNMKKCELIDLILTLEGEQ